MDASAELGGSGTSWATACRHLQDALDLTAEGDEVWVAAGTYYPDQGASVTTGDRTATFSLKNDTKLIGGFAGGESSPAERDIAANPTILSGEIWTEQLYWSLHVVTPLGNATIDGFTITKGNANGDNAPHNGGGAILFNSASSTVTAINCSLIGNRASLRGGAVYCYSSGSFLADTCAFMENTATEGAAICYYRSALLTPTNCIFSGNSALSRGGAIDGYDSGPVTATSCTFWVNSASSSGGAIRIEYTGPCTAKNCVFGSNTAGNGGAIWTRGSGSSITATGCRFTGNTAGNGGAIYHLWSSEPSTALNCTFTDNSATSKGGAVYAEDSSPSIMAINCTFSVNAAADGGAIFCTREGLISVINCAFARNRASATGGSIHASYDSSITTSNCSFIDNVAAGQGKIGGAIYSRGICRLFSNAIWHSLPEPQGNLIYITASATLRNADSEFPSPLNQAKNLLKGGMSAITAEPGAVVSLGDPAVTILDVDPMFLDPANPAGADGIWRTEDDGLRLQAGSPAIDLGLAMYLPEDVSDLDQDGDVTEPLPVDFAGYDRIQRGALDLGAYEEGDSFQPIAIVNEPADVTVLTENIATFTVTASGYDLRYKWYLGAAGDTSQPAAGAVGNSLTTPELLVTRSYWVRVSNGLGSVDSRTATATVLPVIITEQPADTFTTVGATALLSVSASGRGLSYQWFQGARGDTSRPVEGGIEAGLVTQPLGENTMFWVRVTSIHGSADSEAATVSVVEDLIAAAVNDKCQLIYTWGGNEPWFVQSATTYDGMSAAQSGAITHNQTSVLETTAAGPGTISFWWRVSSQSGGDFLRFLIDGVEQSGSISGTSGSWVQRTFVVTGAGPHTFRWSYTKNSSTSSGSDCGWLDEVRWVPKLITLQPSNQHILSGRCADLRVEVGGPSLGFQWFEGVSESTATPLAGAMSQTFRTLPLATSTSYWVRVSNSQGSEASATASVTVHAPDPAIAASVGSVGGMEWFTWGDAPWIVQSVTSHDGSTAMESGPVSDLQTSVLEAEVDGPGTLRFWWKASSELHFDFLRFVVDGIEQSALSGEVDWTEVTWNIGGLGTHRLQWIYAKDESKATGADRGWLDEVSWEPSPPPTTFAAWTSYHGLSGDDAMPNANPAGDGVANLVKYGLELDPNRITLAPTDGTNPGLPAVEVASGAMTFTFVKDTARADITCVVEASTNMAAWVPMTSGIVENPLGGTMVRVVVTLPVGERGFCRLRVSQ